MKYCILTIGMMLAGYVPGHAQQLITRSHKINRELFISYDNDLYFQEDRYYTSGLNINYSRLVHPEAKFYRQFGSKKQDSSKVIIKYHYGQAIFTPRSLRESDVDFFDRPYAGQQYLRLYVYNFPSPQTMNMYGAGIGIIGKASGMGNLQAWWHRKFNMPTPRGWEYQITNEPTLMLSYNRLHQWAFSRKFGLLSNSGVRIGNALNRISQEGMLKFGKLLKLKDSGYSGNGLRSIIPQIGGRMNEELFLFYGIHAEYVFTNMSIEGSLFNDNSPHTEQLEHYVVTHKWGVCYSSDYTTLFFTICRIGSEVKDIPSQRYLNLSMAFRL